MKLSSIFTLLAIILVPTAMFMLLTQPIELSSTLTLLLFAAVILRLAIGINSLFIKQNRGKRAHIPRRSH